MWEAFRLRGGGAGTRSCINMALMVWLGPGLARGMEGAQASASCSAPLGPALRAALGGTPALSTQGPCVVGTPRVALSCPEGAGLAHSRGGCGGATRPVSRAGPQQCRRCGDLGHLAGGSSCCQDDTEPRDSLG